MGTVYSLVIKHGSLENAPFLGDVPSHKPPFCSHLITRGHMNLQSLPQRWDHDWWPSSWALEFPLLPCPRRIAIALAFGHFFTHPQPILESQSIHQSIVWWLNHGLCCLNLTCWSNQSFSSQSKFPFLYYLHNINSYMKKHGTYCGWLQNPEPVGNC